jgi:hypothetical protein
MPTVVRKDTGKMNVPSCPGTSRSPSRPGGRCQVVKGKYQSAQGRIGPGEEDIIELTTFEDYEEDKDRPGFILLGPQEPMVQMKIRGLSH